MKRERRTNAAAAPSLLLTLLLTLLVGGCTEGGPKPRGADNPPTLGAQIDRVGRPAISAALVGTFSATTLAQDEVRDRYNAAAPEAWPTFAADLTTSLGILDALDGVCGTQLLAGDGADRYAGLRDVLLDDRLYVATDRTTCGIYLGLEGEVVGALQPGDGGCGGRTPNDDIIERSYSVLALGALTGFDDMVSEDARTHSLTEFPFIADPN